MEVAQAAKARWIEEKRRWMESRKALRLEELREELKCKRACIGLWLPVKIIKREKRAAGMERKARMDGDKEEEDQDKDKEEDKDKDEDKEQGARH